MLRYLRAMMRQGREASSPFALAQRPLRKTSIPNTRIAYAWHVTPLNDRHVVWHNGGTGGYASFIGFTDDGRRGVIVLTNSARAVDSIGVKVLMAEPPMRIVNAPSQPAPSSP